MTPLLLAAVAAAILLFGLFSARAERSPLTPPLFFVVVGYALGPTLMDVVEPGAARPWIHGLAELTLVLVLFTDASRIHLDGLRREESLPARLLGLGMPLTIGAGALAAMGLLPELGVWGWLLVAAILAPTDAALGQAVVSNPQVPVRIRQSLNVESGLNDGIALPVILAAATLGGAIEAGEDLAGWIRFVALQLVLGPAVGILVGLAGGRVLVRATAAGWVNGPFRRLAGLGLAGLAFAGAELVGGNGFIAAFTAGLTLGNTAREVCTCLYEFGEAEGQLLTLLVFLLFGGLLVPEALAHADARLWGYALLSLTVVRMLPVAVALLGSGLRPVSVAFLGWFGPRGLASILFALLIVEESELASTALLETVVVLTVLASTVAHGVTAYPLASRYGRFVAAIRGRAEAEHAPAPELPVRVAHGRRSVPG